MVTLDIPVGPIQERERLQVVEELANTLIAEYLNTDHWSFEWQRQIANLGNCRYRYCRNEKTYVGTILLSKYWTLKCPMEEIEDTIRHEIAHALTCHEKANHGPEWQAAAIRVGAAPVATYDGDLKRTDVKPHTWEMIHTNPLTDEVTILQKLWRKPTVKALALIHLYYLKGRPETRGELSYRKVTNPGIELIDL